MSVTDVAFGNTIVFNRLECDVHSTAIQRERFPAIREFLTQILLIHDTEFGINLIIRSWSCGLR